MGWEPFFFSTLIPRFESDAILRESATWTKLNFSTCGYPESYWPYVWTTEGLTSMTTTEQNDHTLIYGLPSTVVRAITNFDDPRQEWRRLFF